MKGFILAAGMGTRLKPWTDSHPKALVPVGGIPMLKRVVEKMKDSGIEDISLNVYHFAEQIIDFVNAQGWNINISDERPELLETGGALLKASEFIERDQPVLVHNADILSNADFDAILKFHEDNGCDATLLVSDRDSSRKLIFNKLNNLVGWHSLKGNEYRPRDFEMKPDFNELAFSGIYIISPDLLGLMREEGFYGKFSIIDFFLKVMSKCNIKGFYQKNLDLIDIGKPESLTWAENRFLFE